MLHSNFHADLPTKNIFGDFLLRDMSYNVWYGIWGFGAYDPMTYGTAFGGKKVKY